MWTSDITHPHTGEGRLYLCVVRDGCSRRVLGWAMDSPPGFRPGRASLEYSQNVAWSGPPHVVFHADQGTQYTSWQLHKTAKRLGVVQSMGRTGVCFDCQSALTRSRKDWGVLAGVL